MPSSVRRYAFGLMTILALGGCSEKPFVDTDYRYNQRGEVVVCFNPRTSTPEEVAKTAEEMCNYYKRTAVLWMTQKGQCTWSAPDQSTFYCRPRPGETPPPLTNKHSPMRHDSQVD